MAFCGHNPLSADWFAIIFRACGQNNRTAVLSALLRWLGKPALARMLPPTVAATHWVKAPESLCSELANCAEIRAALAPSSCFTAQLLSTETTAWTLPALAGGEADSLGSCTPLPPLDESSCYRRHASTLLPARAAETAHGRAAAGPGGGAAGSTEDCERRLAGSALLAGGSTELLPTPRGAAATKRRPSLGSIGSSHHHPASRYSSGHAQRPRAGGRQLSSEVPSVSTSSASPHHRHGNGANGGAPAEGFGRALTAHDDAPGGHQEWWHAPSLSSDTDDDVITGGGVQAVGGVMTGTEAPSSAWSASATASAWASRVGAAASATFPVIDALTSWGEEARRDALDAYEPDAHTPDIYVPEADVSHDHEFDTHEDDADYERGPGRRLETLPGAFLGGSGKGHGGTHAYASAKGGGGKGKGAGGKAKGAGGKAKSGGSSGGSIAAAGGTLGGQGGAGKAKGGGTMAGAGKGGGATAKGKGGGKGSGGTAKGKGGGKGSGGTAKGKGKGVGKGQGATRTAPSSAAPARPASVESGNWTAMFSWRARLIRMGVLVRLRGEVKWSQASAQQMAASAGSARNHSARKHRYKEWLGLPSTVGNVEAVYRLPETIAAKDQGPPLCVSVEDAADYDIESGASASAGQGWEGRLMRWAVFERCVKREYGTQDVTSTLPKYNSSGAVKLGTLPRDGSLLLLQYTRPRNIDPYAQLKGFKKFTTHTGDDLSARAARVTRATKFVVFSRARSASTTFITALNAHPNVSCGCTHLYATMGRTLSCPLSRQHVVYMEKRGGAGTSAFWSAVLYPPQVCSCVSCALCAQTRSSRLTTSLPTDYARLWASTHTPRS